MLGYCTLLLDDHTIPLLVASSMGTNRMPLDLGLGNDVEGSTSAG